MIARPAATLLWILALSPGIAGGQSPDAAAERARLGNERIQAEAERRAREEQEAQRMTSAGAAAPQTAPPVPQASQPTDGRAAAATPAPLSSPPSAGAAPPPGPLQPPVADVDRTSRMLEQLRELGELKDAGYVTEDEFRRIKTRILEGQL
jgi:hypothetical protein